SWEWFRLLTATLTFFLVADIVSLARGKVRDFLLVLASLNFGICLMEAAAIWQDRESAAFLPMGLMDQRPIIGWGPQHAGRYHVEKTDRSTGTTIYSVDYTIDSNLLRQTQSCDTGPTIVFLGCSFTFGEGLNDADTLPQAFADSLDRKKRVLNLGFSGYGPQQWLSELQSGLFDSVIGSQRSLFVFWTGPGHAERTACKPYWMRHAPRYALENDQLVLKGECHEGLSLWLEEWLNHWVAYRWLIEPYRRTVTHDDVELYIRIMQAAIKVAKEKYDVPTIILYDHELYVPKDKLRAIGFSDGAIIERLKDSGAIVIDVSFDKEKAAGALISIPDDGHPTPLANRMRAAILKNYLEQNMFWILAGLN
ncbi:MAG TPA: SGNH/GDSL hydrolase family protein, partial [Methylocella sp.]|nr:SGNH/GDSL hydrolase family protein [Methylocella sp.]